MPDAITVAVAATPAVPVDPAAPTRRRRRRGRASAGPHPGPGAPPGASAAASTDPSVIHLAQVVGRLEETQRAQGTDIEALKAGVATLHRDVNALVDRFGTVDLAALARNVTQITDDNAEQTRRTQETARLVRALGGKAMAVGATILTGTTIGVLVGLIQHQALAVQVVSVATAVVLAVVVLGLLLLNHLTRRI